jgi:phosphatidate phosphatase APP1
MTQLSKAAGELLFKNVEERETYPDLPAFYRALAAGPGTAGNNPIFYISLSPWNLFGFLDEFLEVKGLPRGPLLLRDFSWETIREALQRQPGTSPKLPLIRQVLLMYPALPFVLCGDSGQHDPETYREVVLEHPGRIRAIYLRDVTGLERRSEIEAIGAQMHALGIPFVLSSDTVDFAADAMRQGLIRTDWLEAEAIPQAVRENAASESITGT